MATVQAKIYSTLTSTTVILEKYHWTTSESFHKISLMLVRILSYLQWTNEIRCCGIKGQVSTKRRTEMVQEYNFYFKTNWSNIMSGISMNWLCHIVFCVFSEYDPNPLLLLTKRRRTLSISESNESRKSHSADTTHKKPQVDSPKEVKVKRGPGRPPKTDRLMSVESVGDDDVFKNESSKSDGKKSKSGKQTDSGGKLSVQSICEWVTYLEIGFNISTRNFTYLLLL